MSLIHPVANGLRTDHPVPGLPFINDERLPLDNPDAIERTGRNQGEGLWGRTDSLHGGGWVAFTTEPKNPDGLLLDITGWQPDEVDDGAALSTELSRWPGGRALYDPRPGEPRTAGPGVSCRFY
ncbi:hypothetical protein ACFVRD_38570 [Streptomyces sp. NPDC057908]